MKVKQVIPDKGGIHHPLEEICDIALDILQALIRADLESQIYEAGL
jgi:hypothetical protein